MSPRTRKLVQYVLPTILSQVSFFLFTIIDGIFVGQGIGTDALGAINIVFPFVMLCNALFMLATIGGVTVTAIRLGRGDTEGANLAFRHGMMFTVLFAVVLSCLGSFGADPLCRIMGSNRDLSHHDAGLSARLRPVHHPFRPWSGAERLCPQRRLSPAGQRSGHCRHDPEHHR